MKGFRQPQAPSKKELARQTATELKNLQMATRISQMMLQQMANNMQRLDRDLGNAMGVINDLQYRTIAMLELAPGLDKEAIETKAEQLKLKDYNEASDKEDVAKGYTPADTVDADSIVIITSQAPENKGIFRSKFKLSEAGVPLLQQALEGKKVGDKVTVKLGELDHEIEVLGVRKEPVAVEVKTEDAAPQPVAASQPVEQSASVH